MFSGSPTKKDSSVGLLNRTASLVGLHSPSCIPILHGYCYIFSVVHLFKTIMHNINSLLFFSLAYMYLFSLTCGP